MVEHYIPTTLAEALQIRKDHAVTIIAGGTDLMVQRRTWANTPPKFSATMNIMHLDELHYIHDKQECIAIGATTSLTDVMNHPATPELLRKAIAEMASPALRNIATLAGNIGNASPAGDSLPVLYVLGAHVVMKSVSQQRVVPIEHVITGVRQTIIQPDELITEIRIPLEPFTTSRFVKVGGRKADAISKVSFAGLARIENGVVNDIRIAFGAVAPTVVRSIDIEASLRHRTVTSLQEEINEICTEYVEWIRPIDDQRSNRVYRKNVTVNLLKDFINTL